jgi:hypothetical protein
MNIETKAISRGEIVSDFIQDPNFSSHCPKAKELLVPLVVAQKEIAHEQFLRKDAYRIRDGYIKTVSALEAKISELTTGYEFRITEYEAKIEAANECVSELEACNFYELKDFIKAMKKILEVPLKDTTPHVVDKHEAIIESLKKQEFTGL